MGIRKETECELWHISFTSSTVCMQSVTDLLAACCLFSLLRTLDCFKLIFSVCLFCFRLRNAINRRKAAFATAASVMNERADARDYADRLGYLYLHLPFLVY
jgi:hypothetical protein